VRRRRKRKGLQQEQCGIEKAYFCRGKEEENVRLYFQLSSVSPLMGPYVQIKLGHLQSFNNNTILSNFGCLMNYCPIIMQGVEGCYLRIL